MIRAPYTEPYTLSERLRIRYDLARYDLHQWRHETVWRKLACMLPRKLALWAFIRVCGYSGLPPDQITYETAYKAWDEREDEGRCDVTSPTE